jgi:hypothetical protein
MTQDFDSTPDTNDGQGDIIARCEKCGGNELSIPDEPSDDSPVTCPNCGVVGRWGDLQAAINEAAGQKLTEAFADELGQEFDGSDGISFKKVE